MEVGADGVALITIANPPVNALHPISKRPTDRPTPPSSSVFNSAVIFVSAEFLFCGLIPSCSPTSPAVIAGLKDKYAEAMRRDDVKAIVLTGQISHLFSSLFNLVFYH
jgi:enoyl-CoA hydratase/3-hydroxyacyl-CoA dehydrogenase